ncbi:protein of unknown function [Candidatus Nitrosocosmicus franklandus]|uniref:Uncharacterized protein n=1 Tax=Candidatus Nitrosocosmicus franklandianus TaxID=1798806 RepID=A0A484IGL7_9ARCH|nr:protein of unknown function [Candidatus Nitrosocosmicus franklandus]
MVIKERDMVRGRMSREKKTGISSSKETSIKSGSINLIRNRYSRAL